MATSWNAVNVVFLDMPPSIAQASADDIPLSVVFLDLPPPNYGAGELVPENIEWTDLFTIADEDGPIVEYISPEDTETLLTADPIIFTVTDPTGNLGRVVVAAILHSTGVHEIVHDGVSFAQNYATFSSRAVIVQGFEFTVRRNVGWPLGTKVSMRVWAVDTRGNVEATPGSV